VLTKVTPTGSVSVTTTPPACDGPELVMASVYVSGRPAMTGSGRSLLLSPDQLRGDGRERSDALLACQVRYCRGNLGGVGDGEPAFVLTVTTMVNVLDRLTSSDAMVHTTR
jgi:hypothetical protein